jgi:hypothetical protein
MIMSIVERIKSVLSGSLVLPNDLSVCPLNFQYYQHLPFTAADGRPEPPPPIDILIKESRDRLFKSVGQGLRVNARLMQHAESSSLNPVSPFI